MTDRPDEQKLEVQEVNKTPEKAGQESTIGDNPKQKTWGTANEVSHKNDVHPSEVEGVKALDSFGIDFGDGTVETAKGKSSKTEGSFDSATYSHTQVQKSEEIPEPDDLPDSGIPDSSIAQYKELRESGLRTDIPRVTMPSDVAEKSLARFKHPFRGREDEELGKIPEQSWKTAYNLFSSEFQQSNLSEEQLTDLNKAIIRNELEWYDFKDSTDDKSANLFGVAPFIPGRESEEATLGDSQISSKGLVAQRTEFKSLDEYLTKNGYPPGSETKALLDRKLAPLFIGANLAHNIKMYRNAGIEPTEQNLAYGFNPREFDPEGNVIFYPTEETLRKSEHVKNVMRHLEIIRKNQ